MKYSKEQIEKAAELYNAIRSVETQLIKFDRGSDQILSLYRCRASFQDKVAGEVGKDFYEYCRRIRGEEMPDGVGQIENMV